MKGKKILLAISLLCFLAVDAQNIVYVYGDVAADGTIPSGSKKPFHQMRLNDEGALGMSGFKKALEAVGCTVSEVYDQVIIIIKLENFVWRTDLSLCIIITPMNF